MFNKFLGIFRNKKKGKAIHIWYPDILHWNTEDQVICWNISLASNNEVDLGDMHKFYDKNLGYLVGHFIFKSVDENGHIYLEDEDGNLMQFEFWRFIKYAKNESLQNRNVEAKLKESEKYMELMDNFQQAFNELQEGDNHPKRLGKRSAD